MMSRIGPFKHLVRFILLLLLQGLIINGFDISIYVHPMVYILFLLLLPIELPSWLLMLIAFANGLLMDSFSNTLGLHTSSMVFLGALRPLILRILSPREGYEFGSEPSLNLLGFRWFFLYSFICALCHHIWFFSMEKFSLSHMGDTLSRSFLSTLSTLALIILVQFLFYQERNRS